MISKLLTFEKSDLSKCLFFGILCFLITLTACSTRQVMKDCHQLSQGFWDCDKP